jgi:nucleotide-binding universal stress UspA family protein
MTDATTPNCLVVGYDGSPESRAALSLAVQRAAPGGRVVVVHAIDPPEGRWDGVAYQHQLDSALERARAQLASLPDEVPGLASLDWSTELLTGSPAAGLADVAEFHDATEILVGTRGFGRARSLLGSVSHALLHYAACPVTVIPRRALQAAPAAGAAPGGDSKRSTAPSDGAAVTDPSRNGGT